MSLKNIDSSEGYLEALASKGEAFSKEYSWYEEISQSEIGIDIDLLKTETPIIESEPLVIELEDGSFGEMEAGPVNIDFTFGDTVSNLFMNPYEYKTVVSECSGMYIIDGTMFALDRTNKKVLQFALKNNRLEGTVYETATPVGVIVDIYEHGLCFSKDGLSMYTKSDNTIKRYVTDAPYNLAGFVHHSTGTIPGTNTVIYNGEIFLSEDELSIFTCGRGDTYVREYILENPGDISIMTIGKTALQGQTDIYGSGMTKDGYKFLALDRGSKLIREYNLSTAWDLDTMTAGTSKSVVGANLSGFGIHVNGKSVIYRNHVIGAFQELNLDSTTLNSLTLYSIDTSEITNGEVPLKASKGILVNYTGVKNIVSNFELSNISEAEQEFDIVDLVPTMTSNTTPSGIVTGNDTSDTFAVFDDNTSTYNQGAAGHWMAYDFQELTTIDGYSIRSSKNSRNYPRSWQVHGWNGTEWILIEDHPFITNLWTSNNQLIHFRLDEPATYYAFKLTVLTSAYTTSIIYELEWNKYVYTSIDTLKTNEEIKEGDKINIVNPDNSISEMTLGQITETPRDTSLSLRYAGTSMQIFSPLAAKNTEDGAGWVQSNVYTREAIDSSGIWYWEGKMGSSDGTYVMWGVSTKTTVQNSYFAGYDTGWAIYSRGYLYHDGRGQTDIVPIFGVNKTVGLSYNYDTGELSCWIEGVSYGVVFELPPETTVYPCFSCYIGEAGTQTLRFDPSSFEFLPAGTFNFLSGKEYSADTSEITNGSAPLKTFLRKDAIKFNGIEAETNSELLEMVKSEINGKDVLSVERTLNEVQFDDIRVKPEVKLYSLEDKMIDLSFEIWKIPS